MAAKKPIKLNPKNKGKFTKSSKQAHQSVMAHAKSVVKDPKATTLQKRRAQFVLNSSKWNKGNK
jgi:hypothetical protein